MTVIGKTTSKVVVIKAKLCRYVSVTKKVVVSCVSVTRVTFSYYFDDTVTNTNKIHSLRSPKSRNIESQRYGHALVLLSDNFITCCSAAVRRATNIHFFGLRTSHYDFLALFSL
uniref:Ovule protein n=1 Tax=Steinernema glaseri TaxID=37863 RepID=A0A1I7ZBP4_9BILA